MPTPVAPTIEELSERLSALEEEVARLLQRREPPPRKGWQFAVGMYGDDPEMKEMLELGKKIRASETDDLP